MLTTECCLVVGLRLGLGLDIVFGWLVVMHTRLYYVRSSLLHPRLFVCRRFAVSSVFESAPNRQRAVRCRFEWVAFISTGCRLEWCRFDGLRQHRTLRLLGRASAFDISAASGGCPHSCTCFAVRSLIALSRNLNTRCFQSAFTTP